MHKVLAFFIAAGCLASSALANVVVTKDGKQSDLWWEHTIVYQIYPRSFQDSNGDGTGDLIGIQSRLPYFEDLGVETIWLSPIYKSPMKDFGYDISDFRDIDPIFGTMDDFQNLIQDAHARGIKIIMDFVPNHSSDQHEWFQKSVRREEPYTDYYMWVDPIGYDENSDPIPPNNWVSFFRFSAWEYNNERGQFYLHQFVKEQPDLNYTNPLVRQEMNDVLTFWMDQGVDGFRFDAVAFIMEDDALRDEPSANNPDYPDPDDYFHYNHIYTQNLPETRDILAEMYQTIKDYSQSDGFDRLDMLEVYLPIDEQMLYYECSDMPFNFKLIENFPTGEPVTAINVKNTIDEWMNNMPVNRKANWVLGNHDNWRVGSRLGEVAIDHMNMLTLTLPGIAVTYQGEEIGMLNNFDITWDQTVDPSGCNCGIDNYQTEVCSRDPERTPFQWDASDNAGFSDPGVQTWLPINSNYLTINVDTENADDKSHLNLYKSLVGLRYSDPTFKVGQTITVVENDVLAMCRRQEQDFYTIFVTVINFSGSTSSINIQDQFHPTLTSGLVLVNNLWENGMSPTGSLVALDSIQLGPYEGAVIRLI